MDTVCLHLWHLIHLETEFMYLAFHPNEENVVQCNWAINMIESLMSVVQTNGKNSKINLM